MTHFYYTLGDMGYALSLIQNGQQFHASIVHPYEPYLVGGQPTTLSKHFQEGICWGQCRFEEDGFIVQSLYDFVKNRMVTTKITYLVKCWQ